MKYDPVMVNYIDGRLRGISYTAKKVADLYDEMTMVHLALSTGLPKSPRIKSKEESLYKNSPPVYHNQYAKLADKEEMLHYQYRRYADELNEIGRFLAGLSPDEVELLIWRYEHGKTYESLGRKYHMDPSAIRKKLNRILAKY